MLWPLPALLVWAAAWGVFLGLHALGAPTWLAVLMASASGAALSLLGATRWRRVFILCGFPMSLLVSGVAGGMPAWAWLLPLIVLLTMYPVHAWRDAPVFPTPRGALRGLALLAPLAADARLVDAGCGLGDGLRELHAEYPQQRIEGMEWSWPLRLACALRCRAIGVPARVMRADIWAAGWAPYGLVYLFQRPESMPKAVRKATTELRAGAWMASLEFEATELEPKAIHRCPDGRPVWLYQAPFQRRSG